MAPSEKIDLFKQCKADYQQAKTPVLLTIDKAQYLTITGQGAPGGPAFEDRIGALYAVAYTIKMTRKFTGQQDYTVCKLECQWWLDDDAEDFDKVPQEQWHWKMLIRTPEMVTDTDRTQARAALLEKGKSESVRNVTLESLTEGLCVQMLHIGPYDQEDQTVERMKAYAQEQGLDFHGCHHEIYISDCRRVPADRLKTILRHPVH